MNEGAPLGAFNPLIVSENTFHNGLAVERSIARTSRGALEHCRDKQRNVRAPSGRVDEWKSIVKSV